MHLFLSFCLLRQQLSKVTFDSPPISPKTPASTLKCKTPREKSQRGNTSNLSHYFQRSCKASGPPAEESISQRSKRGKLHAAHARDEDDPHLHPVNASTSTAVKEEPMDVQVHTPTASVSQGLAPEMEIANTSSPSDDVKSVIKGKVRLLNCKNCLTAWSY